MRLTITGVFSATTKYFPQRLGSVADFRRAIPRKKLATANYYGYGGLRYARRFFPHVFIGRYRSLCGFAQPAPSVYVSGYPRGASAGKLARQIQKTGIARQALHQTEEFVLSADDIYRFFALDALAVYLFRRFGGGHSVAATLPP